MSDTTADTPKKKTFLKVLKWGGIIVSIAVLEFAGIYTDRKSVV